MLSVSMGMQPVMPMAQGGGLSTVQNSLNINGEPHRLAYINPSEESLLQQLGGSGRKIDGIPAYMMAGDAEGGHGYGGDEESTTSGNPDTFDVPDLDVPAQNPDTFDIESFPDLDFDPESKDFVPYNTPPEVFAKRGKDNLSPNKSIEVNPIATVLGLVNPALGLVAKGLGIGPSISIGIPNTGTKGGYGDTGTGNQGGRGQDATDADTGTDAGGDDMIIREKIAAVKKVPVEEVTVLLLLQQELF